MKKAKKNILTSVLVMVVLLATGLVALHFYAKKAIAAFIAQDTPPNISVTYADLELSLIKGTVKFHEVSAGFSLPDSLLPHTTLQMRELVITGFSYWQYAVNKSIEVKAVLVHNPQVLYYSDKASTPQDTVVEKDIALPMPIRIRTIDIKNGTLTMLDKATKDTLVQAQQINFAVHESKTDSILIREKIPFAYSHYSFSAQELFTDLGPYESMRVDTLTIKDKVLHLQGIGLQSKYDKRELSRNLKTERDHTVLDIKEILIRDIDFGFRGKRFFLSADTGLIDGPHLEIYRDKLLPDDPKIKRLYSRMIRELPIDLDLKEMRIANGHIGYEELVHSDAPAGRLTFDAISATMLNISNTYAPGGETLINAKATFMESAPIALDWSFDTTQENDIFLAKGTFKDLNLSRVNSFLESNLRSRAKGHANEIYFTISGNAIHSTGDLKMNYENFEFIILKKDRLAINKLLTTIGGIFMNDGSKTDTQGYRNGKMAVERDPTKSFFNYLWLNVREGVINTITGSKKKATDKRSET